MIFYRPIMKLAHRFNWHYMRPMPIIEPNRQQIWCEWCGARYTRIVDLRKEISSIGVQLWGDSKSTSAGDKQ